ncbi:MAG: hypothetical protein PHW00_02655 [Clostridia bacterium]|nr:hypothetical protein [Clostridia bacterium]
MADNDGGLNKFFDFLSKVAALVVLLALGSATIIALLNSWGVNIPAQALVYVNIVVDIVARFGALIMAGLVALELAFKRGFVVFIIVAVLLAIILLPQFFPDIWSQVKGAIT